MPADPRYTTYGPQPTNESNRIGGVAKFALGATALGTFGFLQGAGGKRNWNTIYDLVRGAEEVSPSAILKTFKLSELTSTLRSFEGFEVPQDILHGENKYSQYLKNIFGANIQDLSLRPSSTGEIFGEVVSGGKVVGYGMPIISGTQPGGNIADYFARVTGTELEAGEGLGESILRQRYRDLKPDVSFAEWARAFKPSEREQQLIVGAPLREEIKPLGVVMRTQSVEAATKVAKVELVGNIFRAKAAADIGRLNRLLSSPVEIPVVGPLLQKIPLLQKLAVKPGTASEMTMRYMGKAVGIGLGFTALQYYDYLRSEGDPGAMPLGAGLGAAIGGLGFKRLGMKFDAARGLAGAAIGLFTALSPRFEYGLFHGAGSYVADADVLRAKASGILGMRGALNRQEEVTPGLISTSTALGFGFTGGLALGVSEYGSLVNAARVQHAASPGTPLADVMADLRASRANRIGDYFWDKTSTGKFISEKIPGGKTLSKVRGAMGMGFLAGIAAWTVFSSAMAVTSGNPRAAIPGLNLLVSKETPQQLQDEYSGVKEVAVRKGRWWEFGRSAYEGGKIDYFRPSVLARLKTRAYEKGMYGDEGEYWKHNPVLHPLQALFGSDKWKYWYEQKYQYERPEPLSSTYFEEIPFFGPAIAATIGTLIKPRKMIRPEEWNYGGGEYAYRKDIRGEGEPAYELGGLPQGAPASPDVGKQVFNQLNYRRREAIGLAGYAEESIVTSQTGRAELFAPPVTIGTMGKESGGEYWLWKHLNLGGAAGASESVRRFIPKTPYHWQEYNPLPNNLPSWIPGHTYQDLRYGNPFDKLAEAELRLPGTGFAASHPEVQGVNPEDYPIGYRVKILGDIAMYTDEYRASVAEAKRRWKQLSDEERKMVVDTEEQVSAKKEDSFEEYKYDPKTVRSREVTVTQVLSPRHVMTRELGETIVELQGVGAMIKPDAAKEFALDTLYGNKITITSPALDSRAFTMRSVGPTLKAAATVGGQEYGEMLANSGYAQQKELKGELRQVRMSGNEKFAGRVSENVLHGIETPLDYLTPFAPVQKFISQRSAVEQYAATMAIGTAEAAWNKPMEDFIAPSINMARYKLGSKTIPAAVQQKRDIEEYFDMLAWTKARKLENAYAEEGKYGLAVRYQQAAQRTVFGTDVFGSPVAPMRALPRYEKDFFSSFVGAQTNEDRAEIMRLVPENEQRIYMSQWLRQEESAAYVKKKAGQSEQKDKAIIEASQRMRKSEGFGYTDEQERRWMQETGGQVGFDDWLREQKAVQYFANHSLPDPSWIGWNPAVDLEDIKLKYVQMNGMNPRSFDLWQNREASMARKPYVNEGTVAQMQQKNDYKDVSYLKENTKTLSKMYDGSRTRYTNAVGYGKPQYDITISDSRDGLVQQAFGNLGV